LERVDERSLGSRGMPIYLAARFGDRGALPEPADVSKIGFGPTQKVVEHLFEKFLIWKKSSTKVAIEANLGNPSRSPSASVFAPRSRRRAKHSSS
jgi:hypothetical protein